MNFRSYFYQFIKENYSEDEEESDTSGIGDEYWFDEYGDVMYANGDVGDMNHEAYVIQRCANELLDYFDMSSDDGVISDDEQHAMIEDIAADVEFTKKYLKINDKDFKETDVLDILMNDPADVIIDYLVYKQKLNLEQATDLVMMAWGSSAKDGREYAIKNWNWCRVHGDSIECNKLNSETLKNIARGINNVLDQEGITGNMEDHEYHISTYTGKRYTITLRDMEAGNVSELEQEFVPPKTAATAQLRQLDLDSSPDFYRNKGIIGDSIEYDIIEENEAYPSISWLKKEIRNNVIAPFRKPILNMFIIGSEARGTSKAGSDIDVAVIIPKMKISSIKVSDNYHARFTDNKYKPHWNGRTIDFQFFYPTDPVLSEYDKILLTENNVTENEIIQDIIVKPNIDNGVDEKKAFIEGKVKAEYEESDKVIWILLIRTHPAYRNQGYAKKMVDYLKSKNKKIETGQFLPKGEKYLRKYFPENN